MPRGLPHPFRSVTDRAVGATGAPAVFAHPGGWDEILLIVGPMAAIAALLVVAKRRVDAAARQRADERDE